MGRLLNEPVLLGTAIRAVILALGAFGFELSKEQLASLMFAVESIIALVTRTVVTPNHLAESRVADGLSPTEPRRKQVGLSGGELRVGVENIKPTTESRSVEDVLSDADRARIDSAREEK